jgi:hypothetical protein
MLSENSAVSNVSLVRHFPRPWPLADAQRRQPQTLANDGIALYNADTAHLGQPLQAPH